MNTTILKWLENYDNNSHSIDFNNIEIDLKGEEFFNIRYMLQVEGTDYTKKYLIKQIRKEKILKINKINE